MEEDEENRSNMKTKGVSLIILAGGQSTRMGTEKSDLEIHGKTFLDIQIEKGITLGIEDIMISGRKSIQKKDVRVIVDTEPNLGPLCGIYSCMLEAKTDSCMVLSVDTPLVPVDELRKLLSFAEENREQPVILSHNGKKEPLLGVYPCSFLPYMIDELRTGKRSVFSMIKKTGYMEYESKIIDTCFLNINTKEAYKEALDFIENRCILS